MGILDKLRKKNRKPEDNTAKSFPRYLYSEDELDEYEKFISKSFGDFDLVFHELLSPDIHLDVIVVPATADHPFQKLITMGAGAYPMNVPEQLSDRSLEYAEYIIYLPADWDINSSDDKNYWPIGNLKMIARLPIRTNSWLGFGHTVQDSSGGPFAENTRLNSSILANGVDLNNVKLDLTLSSGKRINFYHIIPIYPEELDIKQNSDAHTLLSMLAEDEGFPVINPDRKNYGV